MKPVVAVDIDDTIFAHFEDLMMWYNKTYGTRLTLSDNYSADNAVWGVDSEEEAIKRVHKFYDTQEFKSARPFNEAFTALQNVSQKFDIVVTARDSLLEEFTHEWLAMHFQGLYKEVHFTSLYSLEGNTRSKVEVCQEVNAVVMVDDVLGTCIKIAQAGINAVLFGDYPWNQAAELPAGITRCKDWNSVEQYLEQLANK